MTLMHVPVTDIAPYRTASPPDLNESTRLNMPPVAACMTAHCRRHHPACKIGN
jgi:hypothetical protein